MNDAGIMLQLEMVISIEPDSQDELLVPKPWGEAYIFWGLRPESHCWAAGEVMTPARRR